MVTVTRLYTGKPGQPRILESNAGVGRRLYHYHSGLKVLVRSQSELRDGQQVTSGHRCPICGFIPNDAVRKEQQDLLEKMLLRGFKRGRR